VGINRDETIDVKDARSKYMRGSGGGLYRRSVEVILSRSSIINVYELTGAVWFIMFLSG